MHRPFARRILAALLRCQEHQAMASRSDVRKIALSFPATKAKEGHFAFQVLDKTRYKGFCWVWLERLHPRKPRVPNPEVLAVRVPSLDAKEILLMADSEKFFTEPHYDGFPVVLVRLKAIGRGELRALLADAWATQAPKALRDRFRGTRKAKQPRAGAALASAGTQ
jgi:hypothetical protein